jgi:hypothetical protein
MKRKILLIASLICCFAVCLAAIGNLNGKWTGSIKAPDGKDFPLTYTFKVDGDKLGGTEQDDGDPAQISEGKITGNDFTFKVTNNDGSVFPHSGRYYADGDSVSLNLEVNGARFHTTLKRAN